MTSRASKGDLSDLVGCIYDAALDGSQWPSALEQIAQAFDATSSMLQVQDVRAGVTECVSSLGFSAPDFVHYGQHYWKLDLWSEAVKVLPLNTAHICNEQVPESVFANSEIWSDYGRYIGPGVFRCVGGTMGLPEAHVGLVGFHRPRDARDFVRKDRDALQQLLPHLRRALQLRARLNACVVHEALAYEALEVLTVPLAVVRSNATVLYANAAARTLSALNDGFDLGDSQRGICAVGHADTNALHALIANAALTASGRGLSAGGALNFPRSSQRSPYRVLVSPLSMRWSAEAAVLVLVVDPEQSLATSDRVLMQLFGLTGAEARLAITLGSGARLEHAADRFGVSLLTVRKQLRRIFDKTHTCRQADLVRLLSSLTIVRWYAPIRRTRSRRRPATGRPNSSRCLRAEPGYRHGKVVVELSNCGSPVNGDIDRIRRWVSQ